MEKHLEIEYKSLLSFYHFNLLKNSFFKDIKPQVQENFYYDTLDKSLSSNRSVIRIRKLETTQFFTLKYHNQANQVVEVEFEDKDISLSHPRVLKILDQFNISVESLINNSYSKTNRYLLHDDLGEWCLDKTEFNHLTDFELEYEMDNSSTDGYPRYLELLEKYDIPLIKGPSKYKRSLG